VNTGAIILAAGQASRFGSPKQLLKWEGRTLLDRACLTALAAGCHPVLRVLGAHSDKILERPYLEDVETFVHPRWHEGMGSSLAAGVARLLELSPDLDALLILLPDQALVTAALLRRYLESAASIILCDHGAGTGPPALFRREHFPALMALRGDQGAKVIASRHPESLATIPFSDAAWDLDTPEAWERFIRSRATSSEPRSP
jgi:molybdenum cofactor cytidylyltransferase